MKLYNPIYRSMNIVNLYNNNYKVCIILQIYIRITPAY